MRLYGSIGGAANEACHAWLSEVQRGMNHAGSRCREQEPQKAGKESHTSGRDCSGGVDGAQFTGRSSEDEGAPLPSSAPPSLNIRRLSPLLLPSSSEVSRRTRSGEDVGCSCADMAACSPVEPARSAAAPLRCCACAAACSTQSATRETLCAASAEWPGALDVSLWT